MDRAGSKKKTIAVIPSYNEAGKTVKVVNSFTPGLVNEVLVVNDGSTDNTPKEISSTIARMISHDSRKGIGSAIRTGLKYAIDNGFDIVIVMAGNGKDKPEEIPNLIRPIIEEDYDYIQGSRYIKGGEYGKMPLHRFLFTRLYSLAVRILTGFNLTDGTNGFRAYKTEILKDKRINLDQDWLDESLEYYLSIKTIKLKLKIKEVPVSKIYPQNVSYKQYTKVKPFSGWVKRLKPLFLLSLGIKK